MPGSAAGDRPGLRSGPGRRCGPIVEQAPFSYRPDTMAPGDLLGPFDGMVVDAETDRPIAGAVVIGSWAFERGIGLTGPAGASEVVTETGADGRYRLPGAGGRCRAGASMRVRRFTLVVYHQGYVGWRSDRQFPEGTARRDFSQRGNRVRLDEMAGGAAAPPAPGVPGGRGRRTDRGPGRGPGRGDGAGRAPAGARPGTGAGRRRAASGAAGRHARCCPRTSCAG